MLNEESSCALDFNHALEALAGRYSALTERHVEKPGRIFVLRAMLLSADEQRLLRTAARVNLVAKRGSLAEQLPHSQSGHLIRC